MAVLFTSLTALKIIFMETKYQFKDLPFSTQLAIISFGIGTLLFLSYSLFPKFHILAFIGYIYLIMAFFINTIVFFYLIYLFFKENNTEDIIIRILILLANIPIAFLYAYIVLNNH